MISDFSAIQNNESSIIQHVYASPDKIDEMSFGLEAGVRTMAVFEEYLNVSYKLAKFDQVGLPNFAPEATENWGEFVFVQRIENISFHFFDIVSVGLVQYNEDYLIFDPFTSRATQKFTVARLVSHLLSHQWFGNLV